MSKCLVLNFKNINNKKINIYIPSVKDNLDKDKIIELMEMIYNTKNLFETPLVEVCGAFYIEGKNKYHNALQDDIEGLFNSLIE